MSKSISFILGAGFSAPMGYPVGSQLNDFLLNCDGSKFRIHTDGSLMVSSDGSNSKLLHKTCDDFEFDFCLDLMKYFNKEKGYFDYEEFYDFICIEAKDSSEIKNLFKKNEHLDEKDVNQVLYRIKKTYNQLVNYFLKDKEGKSWYDNTAHMNARIWSGYSGILNCLKELSKENIINLHTLNHDLFFESLNNSDWLCGELCDGFEEIGSPYYGRFLNNGHSFMSRLQYFTETYDKKFRLYKLHGSKDYVIYFGSNGSLLTPEKYVKSRWGIGFSDIYKEIQNEAGGLKYENCWINYHADFLTGTTSKIERYTEPLLFKILFQHFRDNLKQAEKLIIIGYGGKDSEVNKMILENFDFENKQSFIIDPYPKDAILELKTKISAKLIEKQLEDINMSDF